MYLYKKLIWYIKVVIQTKYVSKKILQNIGQSTQNITKRSLLIKSEMKGLKKMRTVPLHSDLELMVKITKNYQKPDAI